MGMEYFGDKLRILRVDKKMTQEELARKLGLVRGTISAYEMSSKYPSIEVLIKLCEIFDVSSDYLLGLSDKQEFQTSDLKDSQIKIIESLINEFEKDNAKTLN